MRHHDRNRKFGRNRDERAALLRSLARSLIVNGRIQTTEAKAKELRPFIEKMITKGQDNSIATRRLLASRLGGKNDDVAKKLVEEVAVKYQDRNGGYTRIIKLPQRPSDGSRMAIIEFV